MILKLKLFNNGQYAFGKFLICKFSLLSIAYCLLQVVFLSGCAVSKSKYSPLKKYSPGQLQKDYSVFRGVLEESHPSIYWYTSKKEMDSYFSWGENQLHDSLNEEGFRKILSYVIAKINCGHTVIKGSKAFSRYRDTNITNVFPLSLKVWQNKNSDNLDTAVVVANLNRKDSNLKRGVVVKKINGRPISEIFDTVSRYISSDGYNLNHKYQSLSNGGGFGSAFTSIFGTKENYSIEFVDSTNKDASAILPSYNPKTDSSFRSSIVRFEKRSRSEKKKQRIRLLRNFRIDSLNKIGLMDLNSFGRNLSIKSFLRTSFRKIRRSKIPDLIIDVRANGGGSVSNSTLLTKFIADKKFKIADSLYTNRQKSHYKNRIENYFFSRLFIKFFTKKKIDGKNHFGFYERHFFTPRRRNHFNGNVYVLTGGNSFSATTLFVMSVKDQANVIIAGEETGGGAYGNSAWLIPDVTLPVTKVRFRLPLFRLVTNKQLPKNGRGIMPEIEILPNSDAIRRGVDYKMEKVMELIMKNRRPQ